MSCLKGVSYRASHLCSWLCAERPVAVDLRCFLCMPFVFGRALWIYVDSVGVLIAYLIIFLQSIVNNFFNFHVKIKKSFLNEKVYTISVSMYNTKNIFRIC